MPSATKLLQIQRKNYKHKALDKARYVDSYLILSRSSILTKPRTHSTSTKAKFELLICGGKEKEEVHKEKFVIHVLRFL